MRPFRFFATVEVGMTGWLAVFAAGLFEIAWAFGLKYSDGLARFWPTLATALAILASSEYRISSKILGPISGRQICARSLAWPPPIIAAETDQKVKRAPIVGATLLGW